MASKIVAHCDRFGAHRLFFARLITAKAGVAPGSELAAAFASTPREHFVGPPPWKVSTMSGYVETATDDPTFPAEPNVACTLITVLYARLAKLLETIQGVG
jgi:hypothetical protein